MGTATNSLPVMTQEKKHLALKRIGWLYPIFCDLHFYHGLLGIIYFGDSQTEPLHQEASVIRLTSKMRKAERKRVSFLLATLAACVVRAQSVAASDDVRLEPRVQAMPQIEAAPNTAEPRAGASGPAASGPRLRFASLPGLCMS